MEELPKTLTLKTMHAERNVQFNRKLETLTQLLGDAVYDGVIYRDEEGDIGKEYRQKLQTLITEANTAFMAKLTTPR